MPETLFADLARGDASEARRGEPIWEFLDRVDDPVFDRVRRLLNHWVALARHQWSPEKVPERHRGAYAQLFDMARKRRVILPISAAHLVETARSDGRWWRDLATIMLQLSRGWQMRSPLKVRHHELAAAMAGDRPVDGPPVFTLEPGVLFASDRPAAERGEVPESVAPGLRDVHGRLMWVSALAEVLMEDEIEDDPHASAKVERWRSAYERLASHMANANLPRQHIRLNALASLLADLTDDLAWAATTVGLSTGCFEGWIANANEHIARMPYLGRLQEVMHRRLRNPQVAVSG